MRADGRTPVAPLVAVWHGDSLYFCTGEAEQKAVNLRTNQHVVLTTGCNDRNDGIHVVVEGVANRVTDDALLIETRRRATKWDGSWQFEARDGAFHHETDGGDHPALVFEVAIDKVLSFDKEGGAATRHLPV